MVEKVVQVSAYKHQGGEIRVPAAVATLVAILLYALLPQRILVGPRLVIPGLELLLISLVVVNPVRMSRQNRLSRALAIALVIVVAIANLVSLGLLLHTLITSKGSGGQLLVAALQVWLTNVIVFALAFWEIDRGGPVVRHLYRRDDCRWPSSASPRTRTGTP
jgi:hypothetical protein